MRFMVLSDYHANRKVLQGLEHVFEKENPDMIFYCGGSMSAAQRAKEYETALKFHGKPDLSHPQVRLEQEQGKESLREFAEVLAKTSRPVYFLPGESDAPEEEYFHVVYSYGNIYPNLHQAHERLYREEFFWVAGFGGGLSTTDDERSLLLHYTQPWAQFACRHWRYLTGEKVLLFHTPPVSRLDKSKDERKGAVFLNELIEELSPKLVFHGMAEKGQGWVKLGETVVVNPGFLRDGCYAVVEYPSLDIGFRNFLQAVS